MLDHIFTVILLAPSVGGILFVVFAFNRSEHSNKTNI